MVLESPSIIGQDRVTSWLWSSLEKGCLSHAYLFVGPPRVGKGTLAVALAQALNCTGKERPCRECSPCRRISRGVYPDVRVLKLEKVEVEQGERSRMAIGIEQVRDMLQAASLPPYEGKYKVFIIDGADHLSADAANRLLKTLEEPPPQVIFLLLAREEASVLPTIASRCQVVELRPSTAKTIEKVMVSRFGVEEGKARLLSRLCGGCPGWAIAALSQEELVRDRATRVDRFLHLLSSSLEERFAYAAELSTLFHQDPQAAREVLLLWVELWRDFLLARSGLAADMVNIDRETTIVQEAGGYSTGQIKEFISKILTALEQLNANASPRLVLEGLLLNLPPWAVPSDAAALSGIS